MLRRRWHQSVILLLLTFASPFTANASALKSGAIILLRSAAEDQPCVWVDNQYQSSRLAVRGVRLDQATPFEIVKYTQPMGLGNPRSSGGDLLRHGDFVWIRVASNPKRQFSQNDEEGVPVYAGSLHSMLMRVFKNPHPSSSQGLEIHFGDQVVIEDFFDGTYLSMRRIDGPLVCVGTNQATPFRFEMAAASHGSEPDLRPAPETSNPQPVFRDFQSDGSVVLRFSDASTVRVMADGSKYVTRPDGTEYKEEASNAQPATPPQWIDEATVNWANGVASQLLATIEILLRGNTGALQRYRKSEGGASTSKLLQMRATLIHRLTESP